jgi:hypothetical protein
VLRDAALAGIGAALLPSGYAVGDIQAGRLVPSTLKTRQSDSILGGTRPDKFNCPIFSPFGDSDTAANQPKS